MDVSTLQMEVTLISGPWVIIASSILSSSGQLGVMTLSQVFHIWRNHGSMLSPGNWRLSGGIVRIRVSLRPNRKE